MSPGMLRLRIGPLAILVLYAVIAIGLVLGSEVFGQTITNTSDVRIVAQRLEDGRIEFGLEQDGERILPRSRFFPSDAQVGRWLKSSPIGFEVESEEPTAAEATTTGDRSPRSHTDPVEYGEFDFGITEDGVSWGHTDAGVNGVRTWVSVDGYTDSHLYDEADLTFYCDHNVSSQWASIDAGWRSEVSYEWNPAWLDDDGQPYAYFGVQGTSDWYTYGLFVVSDGYSVQTSNSRFWSDALSHSWLRVDLPRYGGSITATFDIEDVAWTPVFSLMRACEEPR